MLGAELPFVCLEVSASSVRPTSSNGAAHPLVGEVVADGFRVSQKARVPGPSLGG